MTKLCNMTYTDSETGAQQTCKTTPPGPAVRKRANVRVCAKCWPEVMAALVAQHPTHPDVARISVDRKNLGDDMAIRLFLLAHPIAASIGSWGFGPFDKEAGK